MGNSSLKLIAFLFAVLSNTSYPSSSLGVLLLQQALSKHAPLAPRADSKKIIEAAFVHLQPDPAQVFPVLLETLVPSRVYLFHPYLTQFLELFQPVRQCSPPRK
jgi:hypothetical protein